MDGSLITFFRSLTGWDAAWILGGMNTRVCTIAVCFLCAVLFAMGGGEPTRSEVESAIAEAGRTDPEWWASVSLDYPKQLRLDWPAARDEKRWEPERNPGQYLTGIVYLYPKQWRATAKLFHHMLEVNRERPAIRARVMDRLGHIYASLLDDYARGAYWYGSAAAEGVTSTDQQVELARCYWKLGSRELASETLARVGYPNSSAVLVWAEMGDLDRAMQVAEVAATGRQAAQVYLAAGEACRSHADPAHAGDWYHRIVKGTSRGNRQRMNSYRQCARDAMDAIRAGESLDLNTLSDGTFRGEATGFRGRVEVAVAVKDHAIVSVKVTDHQEDWFFTCLEALPRQVIENQGLAGVDAVTGATMTSSAIVSATAKALGLAKR
ncbi:MAG: FMN-binding protein [Kiritimatiellae bacterium]|nr:FMN-binding protein [Kiritimatiellia bacterium]